MEEKELFEVLEEAGTVQDIIANGGTIKESDSTYDRNGVEKHRYQVRYYDKFNKRRTVVAFESSKFEDDAARREGRVCLCDYKNGKKPVWVICASEKFTNKTDRFGSAEDED